MPRLEHIVRKPEDMSRILLGSRWDADLEYYDSICSLSFFADGKGLMIDGAGQMVDIEVDFNYKVEDNTLSLHYLDTPQRFLMGLGYKDARFEPRSRDRHLLFMLDSGPFEIDVPYTGRCLYDMRLQFDQPPFPLDYAEDRPDLPVKFYGYLRMNEA